MGERVVVTVPGFKPSVHGFRFSNDFPHGPVVRMHVPGWGPIPFGDASAGLCGGMSFAVRDYFEKGTAVPDSGDAPEPGSKLFNYLVRRLWDSFRLPGGPFRYYSWMGMTDERIHRRTVEDGWPRIKGVLDRGRLAPLGFNRYRSRNPAKLGHNHQVLAYGYEWDRASEQVQLRVYDPDYAGRDDFALTFGLKPGKSIEYTSGSSVRGFFATPYRPPAFAWCSHFFGLLP
jgi:hypothetical protein